MKRLNQIEMFKRRGGKRPRAGRQKGEGSTVMRVPNGCLKAVTEIIEAYKNKCQEVQP